MSAVVLMFPNPTAGDDAEPLCSAYNPDWWFDEASFDRAVEICQRCPVRARCLNQALEAGETVGVWGGLTPSQRAALPDAVIVPMRPSRRGPPNRRANT